MVVRPSFLLAALALPSVALAQNVAEVQVAPPAVTIKVGERTGLLATAFDRAGNVIPTVRVIWSSNNRAVASVDNDGTVTGVAGGIAIIEARVASRRGSAAVQVVVQPSEIAIPEASPLLLSPGDVDPLRVVVPGQGGRAISPLMLQWSAADANVARVSLTGVVTAVAPGRTTLTVSGLLQTKTMDVLVHKTVDQLAGIPTLKMEVPLPIQGVAKFQVQALAADKAPVPEAPIRWTVADTSLATFDPATGTLMRRRAGKTTLTAKGPGPGLVATWQGPGIPAGLKLSTTRGGLPPPRRSSPKTH